MNTLKRNTNWMPSLLDTLFIENRLDMPDTTTFVPKVNVIKNGSSFHIEIAAAGFNKEDFTIAVENETLTVSGVITKEAESTSEEVATSYIRKEFEKRDFSRSFTLSKDIDTEGIEASYESGVLTLNLPVVEEKIQKKMIAIS